MQGQCTSEDAWCGRCAERKHTSAGEECKGARRCVNCRDPSGNPAPGHCAFYDCCQFPATLEMRKNALSRREQDPWWWDSNFEGKRRKKTANANNKEASQRSARASTIENASTELSDSQADTSQPTQVQTDILTLFQQMRSRNLDKNETQESPAPSGVANSEPESGDSIQPEELFALNASLPSAVHCIGNKS